MSAIIDKLGTIIGTSSSTGATEGEDISTKSGRETTGNLMHECPRCENVYLSEGSRECSTCGEMTVSVDSQE